MTSKDDIDVDDKDFDAFLRREGDLAQRLQELPQAEPSAALDAAILAAAKADLEKAGNLSQPRAAANDAVAGGGQVLAPSFIRRWRIPLGLAASLLVTVQLVRLELTDEQTLPNAPAILLERAPAPAPAVIQQDKMVAEVRGPELKSVSEEKRKKVRSNVPPAVPQKPAVASDIVAPAEAPLLAREPAPVSTPAPQPAFAPAPIAAPTPARAVAPVENDALKSEAGAGSASGGSVTDQRAAAAPAPAPAPMVAAKSAPAPNPADDWLAKIDALLKAGSRHEALLEWRKFRNAYPDYAVPEAFKEKMQALDK